MTLTLSLTKRLILFICISIVMFLITSVASALLLAGGTPSTPVMRIVVVLQDLLVFIMPALLIAFIITRLPATFLTIDKAPKASFTLIAACMLIVSVPLMDVVISWNENIALPESMRGLENYMKSMEESAAEFVKVVQGPATVPNLLISILIVGVLAGLSEELYFRGALQRLFTTGGVNAHLAIWVTAIVFSGLHFQFYGFVPRLILGVFFGYLLYLGGSVWTTVILHSLNNTMYLILNWMRNREMFPADVDVQHYGSDNYVVLLISAVLTLLCVLLLIKQRRRS